MQKMTIRVLFKVIELLPSKLLEQRLRLLRKGSFQISKEHAVKKMILAKVA